MQHLSELPPPMLARFTQLDYDRELALVVLDPARQRFLAVGRYAPNEDGTTAEFALTVADDWQGKGIGRALLERLCQRARARAMPRSMATSCTPTAKCSTSRRGWASPSRRTTATRSASCAAFDPGQ
jgi:GNAT superfamily N-acetyltransferase